MPAGRPLHELPCQNESLDGSMLSSSSQRKGKSRGRSGGGLEAESTPNELIQQWSPPHKQPRVMLASKGKENQEGQFVLARRSRKRRESTALSCWDSLPDEVLLRILFCLPMQELLKASRVCKRWNRLAFDESLWQSVDLEGVVELDRALGQVLTAGVRRLRCPRSYPGEPRFTYTGRLSVQDMDLSSCIVTPAVLNDILSRCRQLKRLSLEGLELSQDIIQSLSDNRGLEELNLTGCSGFSKLSGLEELNPSDSSGVSNISGLGGMLESCSQLVALNISWCDFSREHVRAVVDHLSPGVTHLNLSGYRQNLDLDDVETLVERCPKLIVLDLSDSVLLTTDSFPVLRQLKQLVNLGLSRCYRIHAAALVELESFPSLKQLQAYGLFQDTNQKSHLNRIAINNDPFSGIARPSASSVNDRRMWNERCRLRYKP